MTFRTSSITFMSLMTLSAISFFAFLATKEPAWEMVSAASGCAMVLCGGYILGRLDA